MICKKCNTLNSNDAKVCVNCGQKLVSAAAPIKPDKKSAVQTSSNKFASAPKQAPKNSSSGGSGKKSHIGILLIFLLIVIAGAGYILVNTDEGKKYIEDLKENETFGQYISMVDSLVKPYLAEYIPSMKAEQARVDSIARADSIAKAAEAKKKAALKRASEEELKPTIKRVKRNMQYYTALKDNMSMVLIPAGSVMIGSDTESDNEKPIHEVYVKAFYIDEHEVTNSQFRIFVEETGYKLPKHILFDQFNGPSQPIVGVSYQDAEAYAKWAGKRLPTEYEWEKAARGGLEGLKYPYTNDMDPKIACYDLNPVNDGPADVKSYEPNDYKLYDMDGNVAEWTTSVAAPYPGGKLVKDYGSDYQVIRGGSWKDIKSSLTVSVRDFKGKNWSGNNVGFRCVMDY